MLYTGQFAAKNTKYQIDIQTGTSTVPVNITFTDTPCIIVSKSSGLFSPIKSRGCTIEILSTEYYIDLYQPASRGAKVTIYDIENNNKKVFVGYLTPCAYDQDYTYLDSIELEAVDGISTGKDFKWVPDGNYHTIFDILLTIIRDCGYNGNLYIPNTYTHINGNVLNNDGLNRMSISSMNFVDDDDEHTPWTQYEVVEEIMKFLGWSFIPDGDDIWLMDYKAEYNAGVTYNIYNIQTGSLTDTYTSQSVAIPVNLDILAPGTSEISIDDIYNKISISDNLYEVEEVAPDIFDTENTEDIKIKVNNNVTTLTLGQTQWVKTTVTKHWLRDDEVSTDITGYEYQTFSLLKPETGFTHHFYEKDLFQEIYNEGFSNCQDTGSRSVYTGTQVNKYVNTIGCVLQRYAYRPNDGASNLPTSLDWTDYLTFFVTDDTLNNNSGKMMLSRINQLELPVLNYDIAEDVVYKPKSGTSWITIKGDMFYQYNNAKYGEKNKSTLNIININKHLYTTAPVDKCCDIDGQKYCGLFRDYDHYKDTAYGKGFSCWKMKLQIGNKYWNGTSWTTDSNATFYLKYNNNPSNRDDEYLPAFAWASIVPNTDYTDKVGENAYCIPIDANDANAPTHGQLHLTIYTPRLIPTELVSIFSEVYHTDVQVNWMNLPPVIYVKDFELDYVYTDTSEWWAASKDDNKDDKLYVGYIDDTYKQEFSDLELKVNTATKDKPISRSYVLSDFGLLDTLKHRNQSTAKVQEYNLVDMYLDHYSDKKIIYKANIHGMYTPDTKFSKTSLPGTFFIDSNSYDLREDINKVNLIAF